MHHHYCGEKLLVHINTLALCYIHLSVDCIQTPKMAGMAVRAGAGASAGLVRNPRFIKQLVGS